MKKNKKVEIIDKSEIQGCWKCNSTGKVNNKKCDLCKGSKTFRESHYIFIDKIRKIAIDTDCGA